MKGLKRALTVLLTVVLYMSSVPLFALAAPIQENLEQRTAVEDVPAEHILTSLGESDFPNIRGGERQEEEVLCMEDFEDNTPGDKPVGWITSNTEQAKLSVEKNNENNILMFGLEQAVAANPSLRKDLTLMEPAKELVFSFSVAAEGSSGAFYLPQLSSGSAAVIMLSFNAGNIMHQPAGESWQTIQPYESGEWYTFKVIYSMAEGHYDLYINDLLVLSEATPRNTLAVDRISMTIFRQTVNTFYVDNLKMTVEDHVPVVPPTLEAPTPPEEDLGLMEDFESLPTGELPAGWQVINQEPTTTLGVEQLIEGKVLGIYHPETQNTSMNLRIPIEGAGSTDKGALRYRVWAESTSGALYLPSFFSSSKELVKMTFNGGNIQVMDIESGAWKNLATYTPERWYDIEVIYNGEEEHYDFYVDGILLYASGKPSATGAIERLGLGVYRVSTNHFRIDDIALTPYVKTEDLQFSDTAYQLSKGEVRQLPLVATPADASDRVVTWESADHSVAAVDDNGNISAVAEGTTTITATPRDRSLAPITTQVTVTNVLPTAIVLEQSNIRVPEHSFTFIKATVQPENATNQELVYSSTDENIVVDNYGEFQAKTQGTGTVRIASKEAPEVYADLTVTVEPSQTMMTFYVSPTGADSNDGQTVDSAFLTLKKAKNEVRQYNQNMSGNIEVVLEKGYYYQEDTLVFNELDSGSNGYQIIYKGSGENTTIGSAVEIKHWTLHDEEKNIYVASANGVETRQLYVDGVKATRARSTEGLSHVQQYNMDGNFIGFTSGNTEFLTYTHPEDLELIFQEQWTNPRCGVASVTPDGDRIRLIMDQPGWTYCADKGMTSAGTPIYYENALELLDQPGEWYLDVHADKMYYMPHEWERMETASVTAPVLEELVTVAGSSYDTMVSNITFDGLVFADTTWLRPNTPNGHADAQNNHIREHGRPDRLPEAAITVKRANNITFINNDFTRLGITGLKMVEGVQNSFITGNRFYNIAGNAINIGDPYTNDIDNYNPRDLRKLMKNNDVIANYIYDIGTEYQSSSAISVGFAEDMDMTHNEIFNIPYSAFHIGYGWAKRFENVQRNMKIEYNFIHDLMGDGIYDGGAIYLNGNSGADYDKHNSASKNYIRNQMNLNAPLYADEGATFWRFEDNVVDLSESPLWNNNALPRWLLVYVPTIENLVINNIYTTTSNKYVNPQAPNVQIENVHVVPDAQWNEEAQEIISSSGLPQAFDGIRKNYSERVMFDYENTLHLQQGEMLSIEPQFFDGKDRPVSLEGTKVYYRIADEHVAIISSAGALQGVSPGKTELTITVVSGGIIREFKKEVYVGDVFSVLELSGGQEHLAMGIFSRGQQVELKGYTNQGREVELQEVYFSLEDTTVATISESGYITPNNSGKTILLVTAVGEGVTVTKEFTVIIQSEQYFAPSAVEEMYRQINANQWKMGAGTLDISDGESVKTTLNTFAYYTGRKYENELFTFDFRIDNNGKGAWPSIMFRSQGTEKNVAGGETGYIICFGKENIELHRFNESHRTVIFGDLDGFESIGGSAIPSPLAHGTTSKVEVGALTNGDDVRLVLRIDNQTVFDFLDTEAEAVTNPGYFGLVGRGETFTLKQSEIQQPNKENLLALVREISEYNSMDYTMESWFALEEALAVATQQLRSLEETQASIDQAHELLKYAAHRLEKKPTEPELPVDPEIPVNPELPETPKDTEKTQSSERTYRYENMILPDISLNVAKVPRALSQKAIIELAQKQLDLSEKKDILLKLPIPVELERDTYKQLELMAEKSGKKIRIVADATVNGRVQSRLYLTKDILEGIVEKAKILVRQNSKETAAIFRLFQNYFDNDLQVIEVSYTANSSLPMAQWAYGEDTVVYRYHPESNTYTQLTDVMTDYNEYTHFSAENGFYILSQNSLQPKN